MPTQLIGNEEQEVDKILAEDEDQTMNPEEISRIFKLYIGQPATPEEEERFTGMLESEKKVLIDYLNQRRDEAKGLTNENKVKQELALKGMKAMGENNIAAMKGKPVIPAAPMMMPGQAPMGQDMNNENEDQEPQSIRDGRFSLAQFE